MIHILHFSSLKPPESNLGNLCRGGSQEVGLEEMDSLPQMVRNHLPIDLQSCPEEENLLTQSFNSLNKIFWG